MIVPFAIDPEALKLNEPPNPISITTHERLLVRWERSGVLIHAGARTADSELLAAVAALPLRLRKLWQAALLNFRAYSGPAGWKGLHYTETFEDLNCLVGTVRVACLDDVRAEFIGLPQLEVSCQCSSESMEIVRFSCADRAQAFADAESVAERDIQEGECVRDLWSTRFAELARLSRQIVVVDRFAVANHCLRGPYSGLRKLLIETDGLPGSRSVKIFSAIKDASEEDLRRSIEHLAVGLARGGIKYVDLYLLDDADFMRLSHGRYIRFDRGVCDIDVGIDVLAGTHVYRRSQFAFRPIARERAQVEQNMLGRMSLEWHWQRSV